MALPSGLTIVACDTAALIEPAFPGAPPARGKRIEMALRYRGVRKQQALAAELHVHESAITRWKNGDAISLENMIALCGVLDISADWLLMGRGTIDSHKIETKLPQKNVMHDPEAVVSDEARRLLQAFINALTKDVQLQGRPLPKR